MSTIINSLQLLGGIILSIGYIPQIYKAIKTKSMKDFNILYLILAAVGVGLMEIYAIYNISIVLMFFITNTVAFGLAITMLVLYLIYGKRKIECPNTFLGLNQRYKVHPYIDPADILEDDISKYLKEIARHVKEYNDFPEYTEKDLEVLGKAYEEAGIYKREINNQISKIRF